MVAAARGGGTVALTRTAESPPPPLPPALQVYLRHHGLPVSGKKAELTQRIAQHAGQQQQAA